MSNVTRSEKVAALTFVGALAFAFTLALAFAGCEHGANIPFDPDFDVCAVEGVEECAPECDEEGAFQDGVDSVVCKTPDPDCPEDIDEDCEDDTHKNVHKHCRGEGHRK
jgi:hypothetical protein